MKAYVLTTGLIFGIITVAHLLRIIVEPHLGKDPVYLALTILAAGLGVWAWRLLRRATKSAGAAMGK